MTIVSMQTEEGQGRVPHRAGPTALPYERRRERQTHEQQAKMVPAQLHNSFLVLPQLYPRAS